MNKLLVMSDKAEDYVRFLLEKDLPDLVISVAHNSTEAQSFLPETNIILGNPAMVAPIIQQVPKLEWVQSAFAGVEPFCETGRRTDYLLTGVKGIFGPLMSEYVFSYILAIERKLFEARNHQQQQQWKRLSYRRLSDLTIGVCGLGSIGQEIADTAAHFRMRVLGLSRTEKYIPSVEKVYAPNEICQLAMQVDYLVVVLPNTVETQCIINQDVLNALGNEAILINVGRGAVVEEQALIQALDNKTIGGAVLDVFNTEPLPNDSLLWTFDNVFITPHNSAVTFPEDIANLFSMNYHQFIKKQPLNYVIDFYRGY